MTAEIIKFPTPMEDMGWTSNELALLYNAADIAVARRFTSVVELFADEDRNPAFSIMSNQGEA